MLKKMQTVGVLLLSLAFSYGGQLHAMEVSAATTITQQTDKLTGTIEDDLGPVTGASVVVKGTTNGTVTDMNGNFELSNVKKGDVIQISFVGYITQEVKYTGSPIKILLKEDTQTLDEVVVVGFGTQKKVNLTGSVSMVDAEVLESRPVQNVSQALQGVVPGLNFSVNSGGGTLDNEMSFNIRGAGTIGDGSGSKPLVLIDGIEGNMNTVNPNDIESVSVLKDAAASSIYGARASFGVILIKTKGGKAGKTSVSYSGNVRFTDALQIPEMMDSYQFAQYFNAAAANAGQSPVFSAEVMQRIQDYQAGKITTVSTPNAQNKWNAYTGANANTDWFAEVYRNWAPSHEHNLSVSGGGSIAKYYISGSIYNENGLFAVDNMKNYDTSLYYQRYNFRSNVDVQVFPHTKLNINLGTSFERKNEPGGDTGNIWRYSLATSPNAFPLFYSDGTLVGPGSNIINPYVELTQRGYREKFWNTASSTINLQQDFGDWITPGLTASAKVAFDAQNYQHLARTKQPTQYLAIGRDDDDNLIFGPPTFVGQENLSFSESASGTRSFYFEAALNYARTFGRHSVGALFLYQQSQKNITNSSETNSEKALPYRHQGIAGRITYNYDNRYFIEGNFGYNGSENFSPRHRFGFFPAGAVGWVLSEEKFFAPLRDVLDLVKFKASYGIVGNDQIGGDRRFIYNETINTSGGSYQFGTGNTTYTGLRLGNWANDSVGWEKAYKLNVGAEVSLFGKLRIQADYFRERREGIFLQAASIPRISGLSTSPWINAGKMKNHGVDASLEYHQTIGKVQLTVRGNFTYAHNTILDNDQPRWAEPYLNKIGQSNWQEYGLVAAGLFSSQEEIDAWPTQPWGEVHPGDIKYLDLNGDGKVDTYDCKPIGYPNVPEITYGFGASVKWKGFDFSVFFQGVGNVNFFTNNTYTQPFTASSISLSNVFTDLIGKYWSESNPDPNARYPRLTTSPNPNNSQKSTFWMVNGRYMRLKNAEIGYSLPKQVVNKLRIDGLRIYVSGMNLLTFSDFKLWDPDLQTGAANYPNNRVYNIGVSLIF